MSILITILRTLAAIMTLQIIPRLVGVRQLSHMTYYDYTISITIGSLSAAMALDQRIPIYMPFIAISLFSAMTWLQGTLTSKSLFFRRLLTGKPTILIDDGHILRSALKKHRLDMNDLLVACRCENIFHIEDVSYAIMEPNGSISFLLKKEKQQVIKEDLNLNLTKENVYTNLVIDGVIMHRQLKQLGKDEAWLKHECFLKGYEDISELLLVCSDGKGVFLCYPRQELYSSFDYFL